MTVSRSTPDWSALQRAITGDVVLPGTRDYEVARKPSILRFSDARPQAVVRCAAQADVAETIRFARRFGVRTVARSGGHCLAGRSAAGGLVLDVAPMCGISVSDGTATVGAGTRLGALYDALAVHDVTIPAGCGPEVGIAGLTLGGGLGILGRLHGLTSDSLRAAQVVLADGRVVECDEHHDEDLFWGLRGAGGGQFGVVTSLEFRTLAAPAMTGFDLRWPTADAAALIGAWQSWAPDAPDPLAASLLVIAPADLDLPPVVTVFGAMAASESDTAEVLDQLVALAGAEPTSVERPHLSHRETKRYLAALDREGEPGMDTSPDRTPQEGHPYSRSEFFGQPLPADVVSALVEHLVTDRSPGQARELDFTPMGGAYNRVPSDATAFVHRNERFLLKYGAVVDAGAPHAERRAARSWLARSWALAHPFGSGRAYQNFPDPDLADWAGAYHGTNYERLVDIKRRYDPDGFFRFPQSIPVSVTG